jgi:hypothetical protein
MKRCHHPVVGELNLSFERLDLAAATYEPAAGR